MNKSIDTIEGLQALMIQSIESLENRINNLERGQKTLRDEFAMACLPYVVELCGALQNKELRTAKHIASVAYVVADAMMEQRSKS